MTLQDRIKAAKPGEVVPCSTDEFRRWDPVGEAIRAEIAANQAYYEALIASTELKTKRKPLNRIRAAVRRLICGCDR